MKITYLLKWLKAAFTPSAQDRLEEISEKSEQDDKDEKIQQLTRAVEVLEGVNADLSKKLSEFKAAQQEQMRCAEAVIDWEGMKAFSIERLCEEDNPIARTVIGYITPNLQIGEWILMVNISKHEELAAQFKAHIASKKEQND